MSFSQLLLAWYHQHERDLPWRQTKDPYIIWVSEIILQQTRVDQGMQYFYRFVEAFPRVQDLARAPLQQLLHVWQGLGYYSRARNMHLAARQIMDQHQGKMPVTYRQWLDLKGVGPYTAAAIASIVSGEPVPALDGNGYRVLGRVFEVPHGFETAAGKKAFFDLASSLIDHTRPGDFNQALMDLGSMVCKPVAPRCQECPLNVTCRAFQHDRVQDFPIRKKRTPPRERHFNYFLIIESSTRNFWVQQRQADDIWKDLYELPLIETPRAATPDDFLKMLPHWFTSGAENYNLLGNPVRLTHQLTHQTIRACFFVVEVYNPEKLHFAANLTRVSGDDFFKMPKPRLMQRFLDQAHIIMFLKQQG